MRVALCYRYSHAITAKGERGMSTWQSSPIPVDGIEVRVHADADGVTLGKLVDGIYASDLVLTPEQAMQIADALTEGATRCLTAREG